jgi:hypothetical protein
VHLRAADVEAHVTLARAAGVGFAERRVERAIRPQLDKAVVRVSVPATSTLPSDSTRTARPSSGAESTSSWNRPPLPKLSSNAPFGR